MRKLKLIFYSIFIFSVIYPQNSQMFEFDYAQFYYDSSYTYFELYYAIDQSKFTTKQVNDTTFIEGFFNIEILGASDTNILYSKNYFLNRPVFIKGNEEVNAGSFIGVIGLVLQPGEYKFKLSTLDNLKSDNKETKEQVVKIISFNTNTPIISDIQVASNIIAGSSNTNSIFYKNTYEVIPNPYSFFNQNSPVLFFYCELYNLSSSNDPSELLLKEDLVNNLGKIEYTKTKNVSRQNHSIVEAGAIALTKFATGAYSLVVSLFDSNNNFIYSVSKKIFIINPSFVDTVELYSEDMNVFSSEFGIYTAEECDALFDASKYIASNQEIDRYEELDSLNAKRNYLYMFWRMRDEDQSTAENKTKDEYIKRIEYANSNWGKFSRKGYKTDRGRVYLTYGDPDIRDRYPNESDVKPYEIWRYNSIEGGVVFVFADLTGFGDYDLIHSTKLGEMRDDNWLSRITGAY
ncbi:MAG: GWxTD domain-containing protein [Ignavibacteriales bacterium]|nr:GWxTD domain-containing protein [Ignavibacteriales bacterium]